MSGREDDQPGVVVVPPNPERFERPDLGDDETAADADPQLLSLEIARFMECAWKSPNCDVPIGCSCGEDLERWGCEINTDPSPTAA